MVQNVPKKIFRKIFFVLPLALKAQDLVKKWPKNGDFDDFRVIFFTKSWDFGFLKGQGEDEKNFSENFFGHVLSHF